MSKNQNQNSNYNQTQSSSTATSAKSDMSAPAKKVGQVDMQTSASGATSMGQEKTDKSEASTQSPAHASAAPVKKDRPAAGDDMKDMKADQKVDQKAGAAVRDQKGARAGADADVTAEGDEQAAGQQDEQKGLPQILSRVQDNKDVMKFLRQAEKYAEQNPTQTILATTLVGAFVGWMLTSTKGKAALKNSISFAQPLVSNFISGDLAGGIAQGQQSAQSTIRH